MPQKLASTLHQKLELINTINKILKKLGIPRLDFILGYPSLFEHGDYATNVALVAAKKLKKNPKEIAELIAKELKTKKLDFIEKIEIAGDGFINFFLTNKILFNELVKIVEDGDKYGNSKQGKNKTVIIDYSSPNIAKRFSIGHLRSTIIGQVLYNLYKFSGWNVIGDNHLGDWGTQFGKMIVAIRKWAKKTASELSIDEMEQLYVKFHKEAEKDPRLEDEARRVFKALEDGNKEERKIWKQLVDGSMRDFQKIYDLLNVKIDLAYGESFYEEMMPPIINEAKEKKVAIESKGALIVPFPKDKLPPAMLLKSDGVTTYFTRDLATIKFRKEKWNPDLLIYEVGAEQNLHFKQVFWAVELLGWAKREDFVHVSHGLIRLEEGKMSTRKGRTIKLEDVLREAVNKAAQINSDRKVARAVGIGAVKYNDLKRSPTAGYVFDWNEALNLKGNSGPYLQYTYARCKSVLNKASFDPNFQFPISNFQHLNIEELTILRIIYKFPETILTAAHSFEPSLICSFLYDLAQAYNTFYNKHQIIQTGQGPVSPRRKPSLDIQNFRLLLTAATAQVLENGLEILGIKPLKKM